MINPNSIIQDSYFLEVKELRKKLHKIPEIAFNEFKTSEFIKNYLTEIGVKFYPDIAKTGIIADIQGSLNKSKKIIILRADMDGLPINEETNLEFKSQTKNMHACGHDGHMAILLASAKFLSLNSNLFSGVARLVFQPAEEEIGGAKIMIKEKPDLFKDISFVFGFHIWNQIQTGRIAVNPSGVFVSADTFHIEIIGKGGHGAMPHKNIDPIFIASNLINSAQSIVSRKADPSDLSVISFGMIDGGTAANITPEKVTIKGTIRADSSENRETLITELESLSKNLPKNYGAKGNFSLISGTGPVINNLSFSQYVSKLTSNLFGEESSITVKPVSVADDMSEFMQIAPSVYALLGGHKEGAEMHHNSKFDFDENCLDYGVKLMISLVLEKLN